MKKILSIATLLLGTALGSAQSGMTAVAGTIGCYANGSVQASWINGNPTSPIFPNLYGSPFAQTVPTNMDSTGTWTFNLADVNQVQPQPSQWKIVACAKGGSQPYCTTQSITITGTSQNVSSNFSSAVCPPGTGGINQLTQDVTAGPVTTVTAAPATVQRVHGVIYPPSPTANTVPVVTTGGSSPAVTYEAVPPAAIAATGVTAGCPNIGGTIICIGASGQISSYGAPFAMSMASCPVCGNFEIGYATTNPATFTFNYSNGTPTTPATLSDGTNSVNLSSPYTSGSLAHSYTSNTTFTANVTATNGQTASASGGFSVNYCTFSGVGTGGTASGATASGTNTTHNCPGSETSTLSGATAMLSNNGMGNTFTGQTFVLTPNGQYMYFLLTGGCGHTLSINSFTTAFATTSISNYPNLLGGSQSGMCIYSTPTFYGDGSTPYTVQVTGL